MKVLASSLPVAAEYFYMLLADYLADSALFILDGDDLEQPEMRHGDAVPVIARPSQLAFKPLGRLDGRLS